MSLADDLAALTAPGRPESTVPGVVRGEQHPRGWEAGVRYEPTGQMLVTTTAQAVNVQQDCGAWVQMVEDLGLSVPAGWRVRLVEAKYDPVAWTRETPEQEKATTRAVWRYRFAVEPDAQAAGAEDVAAILRDALRARRVKTAVAVDVERALVVVYADPQLGKVDVEGGSAQTVGRIRERFDRLEDHVRDLRKVGRGASSAVWLDAGDGLEGFDNVAGQAYSNDLTITEQVRGYRRLTFEGVHRLSRQFGKVTAAVCGSNHAQVRKGGGSKDPVGGPGNDWGIETMSQVQDAMSANVEAYGHVSFAYPEKWRDTLSLDVAGTVVGLAHGHQAGRADRVPEWWKGQSFGHEPVGAARILVTGHWHHTRIQQVGDGRLWAMAPTLDNGSSWWTGISGDKSTPGMLVFSVGPDGWDDLRVL